MKRSKKCFGLLLLLSTMVGLSLSAFSEDTSALKHNLTSLPLYTMDYVSGSDHHVISTNGGFKMQWTPGHTYNIDVSSSQAPIWFSSNYSDNKCVFAGIRYSNLDSHLYWSDNVLGVSPFTVYAGDSLSDFMSCNSLDQFGFGRPEFTWSSLTPYNSFKRLEPYSYQYSVYPYRDKYKDPNTGVVYDAHGLRLSAIMKTTSFKLPNGPYSMNIPIGNIADITKDSPDFVNIVTGTTIDFSYELYITDVTSYDSSVSDSATVYLDYKYATSSGTSGGSVTCNKNIVYDDYGLRFAWSCPFVSPADIEDNNIVFDFRLQAGENEHYIWKVTFDSADVSGDVNFFTKSIYVVTDGDDTQGSDIGAENTGSDPGKAPGSAQYEHGLDSDSTENANWYDSLISLFGFGFLNPFRPMFDLFSNQNTCAQIPTIAGMLHSEETQVCPWFPANVRAIVTPVVGLSSMMLLFGFAVRWLGASSGNFFEDVGSGVEAPGTSRVGDTLTHHGWRVKK